MAAGLRRKPPQAPLVRRFAFTGIGLSVVTLALLFAYAQATQGETVMEALGRVEVHTILAALGLHLAAHVAWGLRFAGVAAGVGSRFQFISSFRLVVAGNFAAAITPARVGGEALRLWLLQHQPNMPGHPARIVAADRALDLVFFVLAGLVALPLIPWLLGTSSPLVAGLSVAGVLMFALILAALAVLVVAPGWLSGIPALLGRIVGRASPKRAGRVTERVRHAGQEVRLGILCLLREKPSWLLFAGVFTMLTWVCEFAVLWALIRGFGFDVPYLAVFIVGALLTILSTVAVVPGGSGVVEVATLALFTGLTGAVVPAFVLLWRATTYYYDIAVGGAIAFTFVTPGQLERIVEEAREGDEIEQYRAEDEAEI